MRIQTGLLGPITAVAPIQPTAARSDEVPQEVLIIASRLKDYVRAISGFNTSDRALEPLSEIVREAVGGAVRSAREEGRKTVLDRDFKRSEGAFSAGEPPREAGATRRSRAGAESDTRTR